MAKLLTEGMKRLILAGLGSIDEQSEDLKDLIRRGGEKMGYHVVTNEELTWNGNREEMEKHRKKREEEENQNQTKGLEFGLELSDDSGNHSVSTTIGVEVSKIARQVDRSMGTIAAKLAEPEQKTEAAQENQSEQKAEAAKENQSEQKAETAQENQPEQKTEVPQQHTAEEGGEEDGNR